jgi:hypothetical protein
MIIGVAAGSDMRRTLSANGPVALITCARRRQGFEAGVRSAVHR